MGGSGLGSLTKLACPSDDTAKAVSVPVGQWGAGPGGQDEEVGLLIQKWPSLAFRLERWIGESSRKARRMKGWVELGWRGRRGMAGDRRGRRASTKVGRMIVGMEWRAVVVGGW